MHEVPPGREQFVLCPDSSGPSDSDSINRLNIGLLLMVEGLNDIEFLTRISRILHAHDPAIPDLGTLETVGRLIFIPFGGGGLAHWSRRLQPLGWFEFHLLDREVPPETALREKAAAAVNSRARCQAVVMSKLSLENFLHPRAIEAVIGIRVEFSYQDSVADRVARVCLPPECAWSELSVRGQKRLRYRAKKRLNRDAVEHMTPNLLAERDPAGELVGWLTTIGRLAGNAK